LAENGGITVVPWTYMAITNSTWLGGEGRLYSGYRQPLPGRKNVRTQRLALGILPGRTTTQLKIVDKSDPNRPLAGYEVFAKDDPQSQDGVLVGTSAFDGRITIEQNPENTLRLLYIRSGGNLLARLPMIPGFEDEVLARVTNDAPRLRAEGFVLGWRDQLVDTIARRQLLIRRTERRIEDFDTESADRWLSELKASRTVRELAFDLRSAKGQFLSDSDLDASLKRRINDLFTSGQNLVAKDDSLVKEAELANRVRQMKSARGFGAP